LLSPFILLFEAMKTEIKKNIKENEIPKHLGVMEKMASSTTGDYILGEKLTYTDLGFSSSMGKLFPTIPK